MTQLTTAQRFWRNRSFARARHALGRLPAVGVFTTAAHAALIKATGGRVQRSFLFTGGMPILVLTTTGRRTGETRSRPVGYLPHPEGYAVLASNAGQDRTPAWWLNLRADPRGRVLVGRREQAVLARQATPDEQQRLWSAFAEQNPGFDEYRRLTTRDIPVVVLAVQPARAGQKPSGRGGSRPLSAA